jgi:hypothetical protein
LPPTHTPTVFPTTRPTDMPTKVRVLNASSLRVPYRLLCVRSINADSSSLIMPSDLRPIQQSSVSSYCVCHHQMPTTMPTLVPTQAPSLTPTLVPTTLPTLPVSQYLALTLEEFLFIRPPRT